MANQGTTIPAIPPQYFTDAGAPAAGYKLFTYAAGSTTKLATYTDVGLTSANANPIVLDSAGRATIFLSPASYKFVFTSPTDTDPPTSPIWTRDTVGSVPVTNVDLDIQGTAGEDVTAGQGVYLSAGDGGRTPGRWYLWDSDNTYSSVTANGLGMVPASIATGVSGSIRIVGRVTGLSALTAGTLYYVSATSGALTASAPSNARPIAVADSTTSVVLSQWIPVPTATATLPGILSLAAQTIVGAKTFTSAPVFSVAPLGLNSWLWSRSTSDFTKNNNTTLGDVTGLSFAIGANETWMYLFLLHGFSGTTPDMKLALTFPAAVTAVRYGFVGAGAPNAGGGSTSTPGTGLFYGTSALEESIWMFGIVRNSTNGGNVQLQMAQQTADVSNTIIRADSSVIAIRVA